MTDPLMSEYKLALQEIETLKEENVSLRVSNQEMREDAELYRFIIGNQWSSTELENILWNSETPEPEEAHQAIKAAYKKQKAATPSNSQAISVKDGSKGQTVVAVPTHDKVLSTENDNLKRDISTLCIMLRSTGMTQGYSNKSVSEFTLKELTK